MCCRTSTECSHGVIQYQVALSFGDVLIKSTGHSGASALMSCNAHAVREDVMNATSTTSEYQRDAKMLRSLVSYVTQPCESGQGVLVPSRSHFEDESCLQGVGLSLIHI